jgi:hypothetical protein
VREYPEKERDGDEEEGGAEVSELDRCQVDYVPELEEAMEVDL